MLKGLLKKGPLFIVFAAFLWSLDGVLRRSLYTLPSVIIVFYEHLFGAILLLPVVVISFKKILKLRGKQWLAVLWVSLLGGLLGTLFYTTALSKVNYIDFSVVVLLQQLQPIFAISLAAIILKEKVTKNFFAWAAVALIAAYLVAFKDLAVNLSTGSGTVFAALLALGAAFAWGSSTVFGRLGLLKLSSKEMSALRFWFTTIIALVFVFSMGQRAALAALNVKQVWTIITITLSTGMVAVLIYYYGLKRTEARVSTICEMFWPISAMFIDFFFYQKILSLTQILGAALLLLSIFQVSRMNLAEKKV